MGLGGISIWQLLIVLAIVVVLFGTKRLKGMGGDLGNAVKGFKKAMDTDETPKEEDQPQQKIVEDSSATDEKPETTNTEQKDKQD
jgi:sec-independent protein translocase protein TatA|tara:strand:+ start:70 stop:324 length:255 start_codon:yes stop_codon:yes gene_type:complete